MPTIIGVPGTGRVVVTGRANPSILLLLVLGGLTGVLSGTFGVGGGVLLVPLLVLLVRFPQRLAAGTSLAAILPAAAVGGLGYALQGEVDWIAAAALALGIVIGAQFGSLLLARMPATSLRWIFMAFLAAIAVSLWFVVPQRDDRIDMSLLTAGLLVVTGAVTGVLSGLLGIGGGVIVVPVLIFFFGASDLVAKGTSLIMLIPGSISGTIGNARRGNVDLRAATALGLAAGALAPVGSLLAQRIDPFWSNVSFSALLAAILLQMLVRELRRK